MAKPLILASQSPRRKELLDLLQIPYTIIVSEVEEKLNRNFSPEENVQWLAKQKAKAVADLNPGAIVIGADTMVCLEGECLGKPQDQDEAAAMLRRLSGRSHTVITAVSIQTANHSETFYDKTEVVFWPLSEEDIWTYIETKEPMDKAGAYGIQGKGALFVKKIDGDYYSVVGLPISKTMRVLKDFDVEA
ncbi:Maf family nucleotide pyrophosphatase [Bacillus mojavensis]|uniref:Maf family nucleotide pyrophosphatase n=1 Tax=Bacillus mojavensis TaxID=72360 RepID=UPI002DBB92DB|nr:Maf family nucleotide pyrophosphatase [Bacillus mojavensis]MEC1627259.1 Maf family nucleotide pyrophosphatase [Bacillus mojavensis]MEC1680296.1 Maf family nucleotide pyrophosphatase [Bacillus mojavensis]MEC1712779.1 Maf family nucleotide pyrophosphatase [Bacillus mojavensis]